MRIVQFADGAFGIRRGFLFYRYRDLRDPGFWWSAEGRHFPDCKGSYEMCQKLMGDHKTVDQKEERSNEKAPERIWAEFGYDMRRGAFWDEPSEQSVGYLHAGYALSLVAAAYWDAGDAAADVYDRRDLPTGADLAGYIRARTYADAKAALERRDARIRNDALREAAEAADRVSRRGKHGHNGVPWSGWTQSEHNKYKWAALDVKHEIEKLITEDQSDE